MWELRTLSSAGNPEEGNSLHLSDSSNVKIGDGGDVGCWSWMGSRTHVVSATEIMIQAMQF
jgi:hypothetical protein